jgi:hypothetical protein
VYQEARETTQKIQTDLSKNVQEGILLPVTSVMQGSGPLDDFLAEAQKRAPNITQAEVVALRMYTGSFCDPWNKARRFSIGVQQWATCLTVLYSAILKISSDADRIKKV